MLFFGLVTKRFYTAPLRKRPTLNSQTNQQILYFYFLGQGGGGYGGNRPGSGGRPGGGRPWGRR